MENFFEKEGKFFFVPNGIKIEDGYVSLKIINQAYKQAKFMIQNLPLNENSKTILLFVKIYQKLIKNYINYVYLTLEVKLNRSFIYEFCQIPFNFTQILNQEVPSHENLKLIDEIMLKNSKFITKAHFSPSQFERSQFLLDDEYFVKILSLEKYLKWVQQRISVRYQLNLSNYILFHLDLLKRKEYKRIIIPNVSLKERNEDLKNRSMLIKTISIYYQDLIDKLSFFIENNIVNIESMEKYKDFKYYERLEHQINNILNILEFNQNKFIKYIKKSIQILLDTPIESLGKLEKSDLFYIWIFDHNFIKNNREKVNYLIQTHLETKMDYSHLHSNLENVLFHKLKNIKDQDSLFLEIKKFFKTFKSKSKLPLFPKYKKYQENLYECIQYIPSIHRWTKILLNTKKTVLKMKYSIKETIEHSISLLNSPQYLFQRFTKLFNECHLDYITYGREILEKNEFNDQLKRKIKENQPVLIGINEINIQKLLEWPQAEFILSRFEEKGNDWFQRVNTFLQFDFHLILKDIDSNTYKEILQEINLNPEVLKKDLITISKRESLYDAQRHKLFKSIENGKASNELIDWLSLTFVPWYLISSRVRLSRMKKKKIPDIEWNQTSISTFIESSQWIYKFIFEVDANELPLIYFAFYILKRMSKEEIIHLCLLKKILNSKEYNFQFITQYLYYVSSHFIIDNLPLIKDYKLKETKSLFIKIRNNTPESVSTFIHSLEKKLYF